MPDHTAEARFRVVSSDPDLSSGELVSQLVEAIPSLANELKAKYNVEVKAEREQSIPIDPAMGAYLILTFVGGSVAGGFLRKLGEDAYLYLKKVIRNGSIEPEQ